jgi:hypothetical protein
MGEIRRIDNMSCYLRHLKSILDEANIQVTSSNRKEIDQAFHQVVGVAYKDCPTTWKALKQELDDEQKRLEFIQFLKNALH